MRDIEQTNTYESTLRSDPLYRAARATHNGNENSYHVKPRAETPLWLVVFTMLVVPAVFLSLWVML